MKSKTRKPMTLRMARATAEDADRAAFSAAHERTCELATYKVEKRCGGSK